MDSRLTCNTACVGFCVSLLWPCLVVSYFIDSAIHWKGMWCYIMVLYWKTMCRQLFKYLLFKPNVSAFLSNTVSTISSQLRTQDSHLLPNEPAYYQLSLRGWCGTRDELKMPIFAWSSLSRKQLMASCLLSYKLPLIFITTDILYSPLTRLHSHITYFGMFSVKSICSKYLSDDFCFIVTWVLSDFNSRNGCSFHPNKSCNCQQIISDYQQ